MWSWVRRSKLGRLANLLALSLVVAGAFGVPAGATEPPDEAPEIWCELNGIERAPADSSVDYRISNLQTMRLYIWVDRGNLRLPEFYVIGNQERPDPMAAVTVELQGDKAEQVPILVDYGGSRISPGKYGRSYILTIPLSEEELRVRFDRYIQRLLEMANPEEKALLERALAEGVSYNHMRKDMENRPGTYNIGCEYSASEAGFWNGRVRSDISVEIYFERTSIEKYLESVEKYVERRKKMKQSP